MMNEEKWENAGRDLIHWKNCMICIRTDLSSS